MNSLPWVNIVKQALKVVPYLGTRTGVSGGTRFGMVTVSAKLKMVFKRFKQIAQLGHLPKQDPESAKAWLYGKLFVVLLTEKVIEHASTLSHLDKLPKSCNPHVLCTK